MQVFGPQEIRRILKAGDGPIDVEPYALIIDTEAGTPIAAGATAQKMPAKTLEQGWFYVFDEIYFLPRLNADSGGSLDGQPAAIDSSPTVASNTFDLFMSQFKIQVKWNSQLSFPHEMTNIYTFCEMPARPLKLRRVQVATWGGQGVDVTVANNSGLAASAQFLAVGCRYRVNR